MAGNKQLHKAKKEKNDEYYTQFFDIESELIYYEKNNVFRDKVIYCNCDDPYESNFFKYFAFNFNFLGLKKLIATSYNGSPIIGNELPLYYPDQPVNNRKAYKIIINRSDIDSADKNLRSFQIIQQLIKFKENIMCELEENGDFRSRECVELLKEADIVVTNPPFSLFREYVAQLMEYNKKFIIVGNKNAITFKEIFPLIKDNKMWVGKTPMSKDILFNVSKELAEELVKTKKEGSAYKKIDGVIYGRTSAIWFTNIDIKKRHENIDLYKIFNSNDYPKYDNYDAINVNKTEDIPRDYFGQMGVPISFLDKYNPEQFELIGYMASTTVDEYNKGYPYINGKKKFARIIIKRKA